MGALHVVGLYLQAREAHGHGVVGAQDQVPVRLIRVGLLRAGFDPDQAGEHRERLVAQRALVQQVRMGVRRQMVLQSVVVQYLLFVGEVESQHLRIAAGLGERRLHVCARKLGAERHYEAVDGRVLARRASDGVEVKDVTLPVLERDVTQVGPLADEQLHGPVGEDGLLAGGGGVLVDVRHRCALLDHDQGARRDGVGAIEPPIALDRDLHVHPARHV